MAALSSTPLTAAQLVAWDRDPAIVGSLAAASATSFVEPVSLQRANTVRASHSWELGHRPRRNSLCKLRFLQWKDTSQLQARAYLKHVSKTHKAAALRAQWLGRKRMC